MNIVQVLGYALLLFGGACSEDFVQNEPSINGVCLVAPRNPITSQDIQDIDSVYADWVAVIPYAFNDGQSPQIQYQVHGHWWGESLEGVRETIKIAKESGKKVMLKPHVWVRGQGWPGDFTLETEEEWLAWEKSYADFSQTMITLADSMHVDMYCIGTEFRQAVKQRPQFWSDLVDTLRTQYSGKLTYASNWDNFENVTFWDQLDYIGVDAYFPLSDQEIPSVETLINAWEEPLDDLMDIHEKYQKPILFTEYGYQSVTHTAHGHWNYDQKEMTPENQGQAYAYQALYQVFWEQPWFAGGFLWKWYAATDHPRNKQTDYTPQDKPAENVIREVYRR